ncbi:uncharacterized protein LOC115742899 isoform X1 [Rhodamnia argentea]|uniref:Uncharacterized protein LOC115742899 isoform X1 n=1 Tax=Rhodamnia argentea TaxID=178133 RepID=A0A8B8PEQ1_9MYRT|nr:uncharacterized protein LOC115742899 isoform X1 [Rhodamnia argentea]
MKSTTEASMQTSGDGAGVAKQVCLDGCCPSPLLGGLPEQRTSTVPKQRSAFSACRRDFATTTSSSIFPNTQFTNHESLPSLKESFTEFTRVYPQYAETVQVDELRSREYYHLSISNHTCLDYIGVGLFSHSQLQNQEHSRSQQAGSSSSPLYKPDFPFFSLSYKTGSLKTRLLLGGGESQLESLMKKRIMGFLNISQSDYCMVFTANRTSAFKLLAESYPFPSSRKLLTVYDYESEAVEAMVNSSAKRGAKVMSAEFSWPRLRIQSTKLRKMIVRKKKKKDKRGLFVFPVHSRVTGARYPYLWMSMAQENGWHVLLDACALGPKDMDSFGLSLFKPDFIICSFYKIFGENPSGFGCLFVKKSTLPSLETSLTMGVVSLVRAEKSLDESSGTDTELDRAYSNSNSFSGPIPVETNCGPSDSEQQGTSFSQPVELPPVKNKEPEISEIVSSEKTDDKAPQNIGNNSGNGNTELHCAGLDHVDSLGMTLISNRARYLINWLVNAMLKLEHPNTEGVRLVRIYGPKVKFDRGPALAFNVFDWKGEKVEPVLLQKLADRGGISLSYGFLRHICFSDKHNEEKLKVLEKRGTAANVAVLNKKDKANQGITVATLALTFLSDFEDVYKLWAFVSQFLDADFVEKERWRYTALNQKTIEV